MDAETSPGGAVDSLCREYGYPAEVRALLDETVQILAGLRPHSVLLHGSASRGELTWWRDEAGQVQLGSDIEMYVVGDSPPGGAGWAGAARALRAVEERVNRAGPRLFHLDASLTTLDRLRRHPPTFRCWDVRATGRTLLGADVRGELPSLDARSIDLRQLNEVPIHRLWEMVFRVPAALVRGAGSCEEARTARYTWARQALDLTTWLLPHAGVMIPTFQKRVRAWRTEVTRPLLARYFAPGSAELLERSLQGKLRLRFEQEPAQLHLEVLESFRAGLRMLLSLPVAASDLEIARAAVRQGRRVWPVETPRRRAYEAYLAVRTGAVARPHRAIPWLLRPKRPEQLSFLLHLNAALAALLHGRGAAESLELAERSLARLWPGFRAAGGSDQERFLVARCGYVDYLVGSSRWFGPRHAYLYSVLEEPCGRA
ncbi:MAG TPA: hypothetical protein VF613_03125 [Longimicrobium sp.]